MGISREEIEAIADKAAERVVSKHSICDCGFFAWHRKTDFDILEQATNTQNAEWAKLTVPHVKDAIGDLEEACRVDLAEAKLKLESYDDFVKSASWDKARDTALAIKGKVSNQLYLCSKEESNPVRVRFDRADIDSAIAAAKRLESEKDLYIFATHLGYTIDRRPPPGMQSYVIVHSDGTTETIKPGG